MGRSQSNFDPEVVSLRHRPRPASAKASPQRVSVGDNAAYVRALVQHVPNLPRHNTRVKKKSEDRLSVKWDSHVTQPMMNEDDEVADEQVFDVMDQVKLMEITAIKRKALRQHKTVEEVIEKQKHLLRQQTVVMDRKLLKQEAFEIHRKATRPVRQTKSAKTRPRASAPARPKPQMPKKNFLPTAHAKPEQTSRNHGSRKYNSSRAPNQSSRSSNQSSRAPNQSLRSPKSSSRPNRRARRSSARLSRTARAKW